MRTIEFPSIRSLAESKQPQAAFPLDEFAEHAFTDASRLADGILRVGDECRRLELIAERCHAFSVVGAYRSHKLGRGFILRPQRAVADRNHFAWSR